MIFDYIDEAPVKKTRNQWVDLGIKWRNAKAKGVSGRDFAKENGLNFDTFRRTMLKFAKQIDLAIEVESLKNKAKLNSREKALAMINDFRSQMRARAADSGAANNNKSQKWFDDTIRKSIRGHMVAKPKPGRIYTFAYDAKHKDTLEYWDKFPLIVFLGIGSSGSGPLLYGLNLHYIPPKARQSFLEELLKNYASTERLSNKTTLKINWSNVRGMSGSDVMIKAYLPGHIKGSMMEIKPSDWVNVIYMPLQQFVSKGKRYSARKVWAKA
ncbi:gp2 [Aeromonas phage 31]|uniref:Gp2 n=1 Tax=Aeromonas phage 31 TaxID=321023 RepID=Q56EM8_9CAUD|nr:DNA end protector [Aeromonas phage 31]AAX63622.1 gp2 [Aeromonas phage 31]APU01028.1 DNA end protector during packaging protein [Aeromonas phage 31.2]